MEEDERRMAREQSILGKFMYKCGTLKSPRTKSDFEKLLANVQKWKATEVSICHLAAIRRRAARAAIYVTWNCGIINFFASDDAHSGPLQRRRCIEIPRVETIAGTRN